MKRLLIICLAVFLYLLPLHHSYHRHGTADQKGLMARVLSPSDAKPYFEEDFVNEARPGRICHVSSVCPSGEGKVACTWYSGSKESGPDVAIYLSVFDEATSRWSVPRVIIDRDTCSKELKRYVRKVGNSLIYRDGSGRLWLFYSSVIFGGWSGSSLNYKVSTDNGQTWSRSGKLILSPFFNLTENVKNKGINLDDDSFVIPVYHEFAKRYSEIVRFEMSDGSVKYEIRKMTRGDDAIQPCLLPDGPAELVAFFRNMSSGDKKHVLTARSNDMGRTWSDLEETVLPNPDSGLDMIRLRDGGYLGVINDSYQGRGNLTLVLSRDGGRTWRPIKVLEDRPGREFSYPSINRSSSGLYHVTYTYERKRIRHVVFNDAWIRKMEGQGH
jgi:predicted neuraminidase